MEEETKTQEETQQPPEDKSRRKAEEIGKPIEKMTAPELREVAVLIEGVTGASAMKKEDLIALIKEAWGIAEEEPAVQSKTTRAGATVKELKDKIAQCQKEKEAARRSHDKRKVDVLRKRINRLKKQTRKAARA